MASPVSDAATTTAAARLHHADQKTRLKKEENGLYICYSCDEKEFGKFQAFYQHNLSRHQIDNQVCGCGSPFRTAVKLGDHLDLLDMTYLVSPEVLCSSCEHSFGVYWLPDEAADMVKRYQDFFLHVLSCIFVVSGCGTSITFNERSFPLDFAANARNGIDVVRFDYMCRDSNTCSLGCNFQFQRPFENMRVIDDVMCYQAKEFQKLFSSRADSLQAVYMHAKVKAIGLMSVDFMTKANDYLQIASFIDDHCKLDDTILKTIETSFYQQFEESRDLILHIRRRDLYQFCNQFAVMKDKVDRFKVVTPRHMICSQAKEFDSLKMEEAQKIEQARLSGEAAIAIVEMEKAKCRADVGAAEKAKELAQRRKPDAFVHGDLKPANIIVDQVFVCEITDSGLARLVPPSIADNVKQYHMTSAAGASWSTGHVS